MTSQANQKMQVGGWLKDIFSYFFLLFFQDEQYVSFVSVVNVDQGTCLDLYFILTDMISSCS